MLDEVGQLCFGDLLIIILIQDFENHVKSLIADINGIIQLLNVIFQEFLCLHLVHQCFWVETSILPDFVHEFFNGLVCIACYLPFLFHQDHFNLVV